MRLPNAAHESRPWRIREIAPDFTLEDVWALPVHGGAGDFPALLAVMASRDLTHEASPVTRLLFGVRWLLGRWFGWDDGAERPIPGQDETSAGRTAAGGPARHGGGPEARLPVRAAVSHRHRIRRGNLEPDRARRDAPGLGRSRRRPLPGADGRLRQAARPARETVHGVHRAVPALGGLPGPDAPDRTGRGRRASLGTLRVSRPTDLISPGARSPGRPRSSGR